MIGSKNAIAFYLCLAVSMVACDVSTSPEDICDDRAYDECVYVAGSRCGLSSNARESELRACRPFVECEDAAYSDCMDEHE